MSQTTKPAGSQGQSSGGPRGKRPPVYGRGLLVPLYLCNSPPSTCHPNLPPSICPSLLVPLYLYLSTCPSLHLQ